jgi:hypothetical protein
MGTGGAVAFGLQEFEGRGQYCNCVNPRYEKVSEMSIKMSIMIKISVKAPILATDWRFFTILGRARFGQGEAGGPSQFDRSFRMSAPFG